MILALATVSQIRCTKSTNNGKKISKLDLVKIKKICSSIDTIKKKKTHKREKNICKSYTDKVYPYNGMLFSH